MHIQFRPPCNKTGRSVRSPRTSHPEQPNLARTQSPVQKIETVLTTEDINDLKREKQYLLQERKLLNAKFQRFDDIIRHISDWKRNERIAIFLEQQVQELREQKEKDLNTLNKILYSDEVCAIEELQEETKMLYCEILRLKKDKQEMECNLRHIYTELGDTCQKYSTDILKQQQNIINNLKCSINFQERKNQKTQQKENNDDFNVEVQNHIKSLKAKIEDGEKQIGQLKKKMLENSEEKITSLKQMHYNVYQIGRK